VVTTKTEDNQCRDLATSTHWQERYARRAPPDAEPWTPRDYNALVTGHLLARTVERCTPSSVFEVGCGDSVWLPYLARRFDVAVAGVDYAELGCELARNRLAHEGVDAQVFCEDIFAPTASAAQRYDLVFSLGLIEHFTDLEAAVAAVLRYVKPGGHVLNLVPNFSCSLHTVAGWIWQPAVMRRHQAPTRRQLMHAHARLGLTNLSCRYCGLFSFYLLAWGVEPRWPRLERLMLTNIHRVAGRGDRLLRLLKGYDWSIPPLSPYLYVIGQKPRS